jgi:hypothetical protein
MITTKAGAQGFRWFFGRVEDRDDPKKLGRVRVRAFNVHPQKKSLVTTEDLHWAFPLLPPFSAGNQGVGISPTGIMVGSIVFGFFADGDEGQIPLVMGTLAAMPDGVEANNDLPKTAREINDVKKTQIGPEPASPYKTKYPHNKVMQTERGHVFEVDDTPGGERIHLYHRSGTYTEIDSSGQKVNKVVGNEYNIIAGNEEVYIEGNVNVRVLGNVNILVDGTYTLESKGNMTLKAPRIDLNP